MKKASAIVLCILFLISLCACDSSQASSDTDSTPSSIVSETESVNSTDNNSQESGREMYIESLKNNDVFKQYAADDWRSHAYDYKLIALTFDDGPAFSTVDDNNVAVRIVDTLLQYEGKGTFFFTGRSLASNGYAVPQYALNNGFDIANHSYDHASLKETDYETTVQQIVGVNDLLQQNLSVTPKYFRGGGFTQSDSMWNVLTEQNMVGIAALRGGRGDHAGGSVTVDSLAAALSPESVIDGEIICMHSTNKTGVTPDALAIALPLLYQQGYRFCTLTELFTFRGVGFDDIPKGEYIKKVEITDNGKIAFN